MRRGLGQTQSACLALGSSGQSAARRGVLREDERVPVSVGTPACFARFYGLSALSDEGRAGTPSR